MIPYLDSSLVYPLHEGSTLNDLDELLSRTSADRARDATSYVFRSAQQFFSNARDPNGKSIRDTILRRARDKPVILLTYSRNYNTYTISRLTSKGLAKIVDSDAPHQIRQVELRTALEKERNRCEFKAPTDHHFVTPSLVHCSGFVRLGDAIQNLEILDALTFWLREHIAVSDAVLVDTWSISSIVLRAMQTHGSRIVFDCLSSHPKQDRDSAKRIIDRLIRKADRGSKLTFVISIASTGRLVESVASLLSDVSGLGYNLAPISLYSFATAPATLSSLCRLPDSPENYPSKEACELCAKGSRAVEVDPNLYYIKRGYEDPVLLRSQHFQDGRSFLESYGTIKNTLRVHRDDPNDGRHHGLDVDVKTLLEIPGFQNSYIEKLRSSGKRPDIIVAPDHTAGRKLVEIASRVLSSPYIVHNDLRPGGIPTDKRTLLTSAQTVLILDDVLNTGSRLEAFNRSLRENTQGNLKNLIFLVGVARPSSQAELDQLKVALTAKVPWAAHLGFVTSLYLPRFGPKECPWCREFDYLTKATRRMADPPEWLIRRVGDLANRDQGLSDEPLLLLPGITSRVLGDGSPAGSKGWSSLCTLFSVAAALQDFRNCPEEQFRLNPGFPFSKVFSSENLKARYTEGLLRGILLRLLNKSEWGSGQRHVLRELLFQFGSKPDQDIIVGELLLLMYNDIIPPFETAELKQLYFERLGSSYRHLLGIACP